jgi:hypothetical protein
MTQPGLSAARQMATVEFNREESLDEKIAKRIDHQAYYAYTWFDYLAHR